MKFNKYLETVRNSADPREPGPRIPLTRQVTRNAMSKEELDDLYKPILDDNVVDDVIENLTQAQMSDDIQEIKYIIRESVTALQGMMIRGVK